MSKAIHKSELLRSAVETERVTIRIDSMVLRKVEELAEDLDTSKSQVIREFVRRGIERIIF